MGTSKSVKVTAKKAASYVSGLVEREPGDRWVSMSNALVRAGHGLSLAEKRVIASAVSQLDSMKSVKPGESPSVRINASEYAETFGVDPTTAYEQLEDAAKVLYERSISFFEPNSRRKGAPLVVTKMRWVGAAKYHRGEGWVELHFWHQLVPHLLGLRKQFTTYQLAQASALRSAYSWRLLELLMRFESTGWAEYSLEDFSTAMDATEKQRADFAKIRTKIIEPAVRELAEKDNWMIEWKPIKAGRRVSALRFTFVRNPQQRLL